MSFRDLENEIKNLKKRVEHLENLTDPHSKYAPCKNAYKDNRDGLESCNCWRCSPYEKI